MLTQKLPRRIYRLASQKRPRPILPGHYSLPNLPPGEYEVSVAAPEYSTNTLKVTISAAGPNSANVTLAGALSLSDLGFTSDQAQGTTADQARLNKRSHMLMLHQRIGLIAAIPMIATVATSFGAGGRSTSTSDRYLHLALGSATGDLYFMSAYFAIRAPSIPGTQRRGQIRVHRALAWIHGPGMILTPILGAMAFDQKKQRGESPRNRQRSQCRRHRNRSGLWRGHRICFIQILKIIIELGQG